MSGGIIALIVVVVVVVLVVGWAVAQYNGLVRLRNLVQEAWRQIDTELQRRHDLIPNLVETVKGYAAHERGVFDEVTAARAAAAQPGAGPAQQERVIHRPALGPISIANDLVAVTLLNCVQCPFRGGEPAVAVDRPQRADRVP